MKTLTTTPRAAPASGATVVNFADFLGRKPARAAMKPAVESVKADTREQRYKIWDNANNTHEFYEALCDLGHRARIAFERHGVRDAEPFAPLGDFHKENYHAMHDKRRAAYSELLVTPAPTVGTLNRKKAMLASKRGWPVSESTTLEAEKLIAADEAWLAANARSRSRRAVQS